MSDTTGTSSIANFTTLDKNGTLFLVNQIFTKLKGSPLAKNTTYAITQSTSDAHAFTITGSDGYTNTITIPDSDTKYSDVTNSASGLMTSDYKKKLDSVESGAQVNILDNIKVNGAAQAVTDKSVDISVPTDNKQLKNGAGYQTASEVNEAIATAVADAVAKIIQPVFEIVDALPDTGNDGVFYLIKDTHADSNDGYDEYIWISKLSKYEKLGNTDIDLSGYVKTSDIESIDNESITKIVSDAYADVFGN